MIAFISISHLIYSENCSVQFNFLVKNKTWKPANTAIINGVTYIDIESENDSFSLQLLNDINCLNTLGNIYFEENKLAINKKRKVALFF